MEGSPRSQRLSVGSVVGETFAIYGRHLGVLLVSAFLLFLIVGVVTAIIAGPARDELSIGELLLVLLALAIRVAAGALYAGFLVRLVQEDRGAGQHGSLGRLYASAAPAIPALVLMSIVFGLGVAIGLFLLVIPGLILLTIWALAAPAIVVEGAGPLQGLGRSRELVRGHGWTVFGVLVVMWLITVVVTAVLGGIGDAISGVGYGAGVTIAAFLTAPLHALAVSVMFFDLGGGREAAEPAPAQAPATT